MAIWSRVEGGPANGRELEGAEQGDAVQWPGGQCGARILAARLEAAGRVCQDARAKRMECVRSHTPVLLDHPMLPEGGAAGRRGIPEAPVWLPGGREGGAVHRR